MQRYYAPTFIDESRTFPGGQGRQGHKSVKRLPITTASSFPVNGDPLARAWRILAADHGDILPSHGLPVAVERCATRCYGNAIVPDVAAKFIEAALTCR